MPQSGFTLGDHTFLHPSENGPISRLKARKKQILGAPPPSILEGIAKESPKSSKTARDLFKGTFCGHGEPTMTIFDLVVDGSRDIDMLIVMDEECEAVGANPPLIAVRAANTSGEFRVVFRREWEDNQSMLQGVRAETISQAEGEKIGGHVYATSASIGFEYPCDASNKDDVSWLTIDAWNDEEDSPQCIVNAEMA